VRRTDELISGNPWLRRLRSGSGAATLVCFPHAGGSAGYFRNLAGALSADIEVLAIQYPGRQNRFREKAIESVTELAAGAVAALSGRQCDIFFGHSLGGHVAFETAQKITVRKLVVSSIVAPSRVVDLGYHLLDGPDGIEKIKALGGLPPEILNDELALNSLMPILRSDFLAGATYRPSSDAAVLCDVSALVSDNDAIAPVESVKAWHKHTRGNFNLKIIPGGGHFFLEEQINEVVSCLEQALSSRGDPAAVVINE
jgi:surfactin synthase thioesterase subunit